MKVVSEELGTGVTCEVTKLRLLIRHRTQNEEFVTLHGPSPSVLQSRALPRIVDSRASNEGSRRLHNHGEGFYWGLLLVERAY